MKKAMYINARHDGCRIAIAGEEGLTELYTERASSVSIVGNIYKGRVTNVEPSIQAAFVDFGSAKNGFLHISDLHPDHFPGGHRQTETLGAKHPRRDRPPIQQCLRRGQPTIVQVTKDGIGTKGATLTNYLSIPGRFLVLMPGLHRLGVSRKLEDEVSRSRMRTVLAELNPPPEIGFIVRTAGVGRPKRDLQRDMHYLLRLWKAVSQRSKEARAPAELYQESDLVIRTIRDVYNSDIERIVCDEEDVALKVKEFFKITMPRSAHRVELYTGSDDLFHAFDLAGEFDSINTASVPLPSGGSLVIEQTEALVAVDVNSGKMRDSSSAEATAVRTNAEAGEEVCRQLRLRDLGGVIIIDFIDMMEEKNRRRIENLVRTLLKEDRARTKVLRISRLGIMEMTRQRVRPSLISRISQPCPNCGGDGGVQAAESLAQAAMRSLRLAAMGEKVVNVELAVPPAVAEYMLNQMRQEIYRLEQDSSASIAIKPDPAIAGGENLLRCTDARGSDMPCEPAAAPAEHRGKPPTREITASDLAEYSKRQGEEAKAEEPAEEAQPPQAQAADGPPAKKKSRRGRRRRKPAAASGTAPAAPATPEAPEAPEAEHPSAAEPQPDNQAPKKKTRRGRRGSRSASKGEDKAPAEEQKGPSKKKSSRRRRKRRPSRSSSAYEKPAAAPSEGGASED